MIGQHEGFAFVDSGRTFTCFVETTRRATAEAWWWFRVSTEEHGRYAPFRADDGDTTDAVRGRVVAYYDNLLARRAEPWRGHRPNVRAAAPTTAAQTPVAAAE